MSFLRFARTLRGLSILTAVMMTITLVLVFFYAPLDADQGFVQKIFYIHVPLAIVSLAGFVIGGGLGLLVGVGGGHKK